MKYKAACKCTFAGRFFDKGEEVDFDLPPTEVSRHLVPVTQVSEEAPMPVALQEEAPEPQPAERPAKKIGGKRPAIEF